MPIGPDSAEKIASAPDDVSQHSFYPLLSYSIKSEKIKRSPSRRTITKTQKERLIRYAAHVDSHIYSHYAWNINKKYEEQLQRLGLSSCVLAFRKLGASNIEFAAKAFDAIKSLGDCTAFAFDVTGFFDNIDHQTLKRSWCNTLGTASLPDDHYAVYKSLTRFCYVDRSDAYRSLAISVHNPSAGRPRLCSPQEFRDKIARTGLIKQNTQAFGIPQGTPISATLSNVYLVDFDLAMQIEARSRGGVYFRYCDDILIIIPAGKETALTDAVTKKLEQLKLETNPSKTERRHFTTSEARLICDKPLQYLGFLFDGKRVLLRSSALAKFSGRMNRGVRLAKLTATKRNSEKFARGLPTKPLYKSKLYERYSHLGGRNFIRYGLRAARIMKSPGIKKQIRPLWGRLKTAIEKP